MVAAAGAAVAAASMSKRNGVFTGAPSCCEGSKLLANKHLSKGSLNDSYELVEVLGNGKSGMVYRVKNRESEQPYMVKRIPKTGSDDELLHTVRILRRLGQDPHIDGLVDCFETDTHIIVVMDLCHGLDLLEALNTKGDIQAIPNKAMLFRDMMCSLGVCEARGVTHLDIKLENFLMATAENEDFDADASAASCVRLVDFRLSQFGTDLETLQESGLYCGSRSYSAPEVIANGDCSPASDMWSLGIAFYVIVAGRFPFELGKAGCPVGIPSSQMVWEKQLRTVLTEVQAPRGAVELMVQMLCLDPKRRIKASNALKQPYLANAHKADSTSTITAAKKKKIDTLVKKTQNNKIPRSELMMEEVKKVMSADDEKDLALTYLEKNLFFAGSDAKFIKELSKVFKPMTLCSGDILWKQGEQRDEMFIVRQGSLDFYSRAPDEDELPDYFGKFQGFGALVDSVPSGAVVGEMEFLVPSSAGHHMTAVVPSAIDRVDVFCIMKKDFEATLKKFPKEKERLVAHAISLMTL